MTAMLCETILSTGVRSVFGVQGDYNIDLLKAIDEDDRFTFVHAASNFELGLLADGYSRVHSSRVGVCSFTRKGDEPLG